ncbi:MAG TPA: hypothetical protein PLI01_15450, partial [Nitrospira sp.]|nr:hypothetical protein [Nitrospira sp.]
MAQTFRELREVIEHESLTWQPLSDRSDTDRVVQKSLGGDIKGLQKAEAVPSIDFKETLGVGTNPRLAIRRLERGFVRREALEERFRKSELMRLGYGDLAESLQRDALPEGGA